MNQIGLFHLKKKIEELKVVKEEKEKQYDILNAQFKRVEDDTRKYKREIEDLNKDKNSLSSKIAELTLHIDTAQRLFKKTVSKKEVSKSKIDLKKKIKNF